ncbi:hypothetical protein ES707_07413 [subsurface metagenome]
MEGISDRQSKIWLCYRCKAVFNGRWLLARHLRDVHDTESKEASREAKLSEWWRVFNPRLKEIH